MKAESKRFFRACLLILEAARDRQAATEIFRLDEKSRAMLRDHLLRLDGGARRQRFGDCGLKNDFLESYVQNIDFGNTAIFGLLADGHIRASAELRLFRTADFAWSKSGSRRTVFGLGWARFEVFLGIVGGPPWPHNDVEHPAASG